MSRHFTVFQSRVSRLVVLIRLRRKARLAVTAGAVAVALTLVCADSSLAKEEPVRNPDYSVVKLEFAWPAGLSGVATTDVLRIQRQGGRAVTFDVADRTAFKLEPDERGMLVRFTGIKTITRITPEPPGRQGELQKLIQKLSAMQPSYIVSPDGELVDVAGLDRFRTAILAQFDKLGSSLPENVRSQLQTHLMKQYSRDQLLALLSEDWNRDVGQWVGASLEIGTTYELESSSPPIPLLGNSTLPGHYTYEARRRVPCDGDSRALDCVELHMTSRLDPGKTAAALQRYAEAVAKQAGAGAERIKSVRLTFDLTLVTEPSTLIPHDATTITRTVLTTIDSDGKRSTSYDTESVTVHYQYD